MVVEGWTEGFKERFEEVIRRVGGLTGASARLGVKAEQVGKWRDGKARPPLFALHKLAREAGVTLDWLITGEREDPRGGERTDPELLGRVTDAIERLYKEENVRLSPIDLGRLAAEKYDELIAASEGADERPVMLKLIIKQLRSQIHSAAAEPGTGKASA